MNKTQTNDFKTYLAEQLKDPKARAYFTEYGKQLEIAYQLLQMRKKHQ